VFSQWNRLLSLIQEALLANGVGCAMMTGAKRDQQVQQFRRDPATRVLLVSMRSSGGAAGLTLTNANHAFIMEPSINISIEDQAHARVHRIGQRRPVTVTRLLTKGTIEEKILELQRRKREAAEVRGQASSRDEQEKLQTGEVLQMFGLERP